jgi:hypothetical protein
MRENGARGSWPSDQLLIQWGAWKWFLSIIFFDFVKFVVNQVVMYIVEAQVKRASEEDEPIGWR